MARAVDGEGEPETIAGLGWQQEDLVTPAPVGEIPCQGRQGEVVREAGDSLVDPAAQRQIRGTLHDAQAAGRRDLP
ncbi:hypothetical protein Acy02nite_35580 [Actinoplanes cyaneus]|uniref:Uncharacterized protein n=1 Tax=Actinoplanes cyaneus TaxID=52696 RepID=A0A919M4J4_9ACTN|nr:hypothetical protein Acy02nite_35580 [Actinoplanes cyaneus]